MTTEEYWEGRLFLYHGEITNGAGGGGNISWVIIPGRGNELELLYGHLQNGDTAGRTGSINIETDTSGELVTRPLTSSSFAAGARRFFPVAEPSADNTTAGPARWIISGIQRISVTMGAVAASENAVFSFAARLRGGMPGITEAGNSTPTIAINVEQVF